MFLWDNHWGFGNVSNTLTLKQAFWKTESFLKKLEHGFLVQGTMDETATLPCKTALLKTDVKANWIEHTKWTYDKEWTFTTDYFIFIEI